MLSIENDRFLIIKYAQHKVKQHKKNYRDLFKK